MRNEILESLDVIQEACTETEVAVAEALIQECYKAMDILEYSNTDPEQFYIIQEGKIMDDVKEQGKNQSKAMRVLTFIPRLIAALFKAITGKLKDSSEKFKKAREENKKAKEKYEKAKAKAKDKEEKKSSVIPKIVGGGLLAIAGAVGIKMYIDSKDEKPKDPIREEQKREERKPYYQKREEARIKDDDTLIDKIDDIKTAITQHGFAGLTEAQKQTLHEIDMYSSVQKVDRKARQIADIIKSLGDLVVYEGYDDTGSLKLKVLDPKSIYTILIDNLSSSRGLMQQQALAYFNEKYGSSTLSAAASMAYEARPLYKVLTIFPKSRSMISVYEMTNVYSDAIKNDLGNLQADENLSASTVGDFKKNLEEICKSLTYLYMKVNQVADLVHEIAKLSLNIQKDLSDKKDETRQDKEDAERNLRRW